MRTNSELRAEARKKLSGNWLLWVIAILIVSSIGSLCSTPMAAFSFSQSTAYGDFSVSTSFSPFFPAVCTGIFALILLITAPLQYGMCIAELRLVNDGDEKVIENLFSGFKHFGRSLAIFILYAVFIYLWTLLLIVPGIIKIFSYSQAFYISIENPDLSANECINRSRDMMRGNKWKYFCLIMSFCGWALLCLLTLGLGFYVLMPYVKISCAEFYQDVKAKYEARIN